MSFRAPVGRLELMTWVNDSFDTDYQRVEQLADGVVYCQALDAAAPGKVSLTKLNFNAQFEQEFERNLKVLLEALKRVNTDRAVPVEKLKKGHFQDNQDFMLWMYSFLQHRQVNLKLYGAYEKRLAALAKQQQQQQQQRPNSSSLPKPPGQGTGKAPATSKTLQMKAELQPNKVTNRVVHAKQLAAYEKHHRRGSDFLDPEVSSQGRSLPSSTSASPCPSPLPEPSPSSTAAYQATPSSAVSFSGTSAQTLGLTPALVPEGSASGEGPRPSRIGGGSDDLSEPVRRVITTMEEMLNAKAARQAERWQRVYQLKAEVDQRFAALASVEQLCHFTSADPTGPSLLPRHCRAILNILTEPDPMM